jgi:hypothetical protein
MKFAVKNQNELELCQNNFLPYCDIKSHIFFIPALKTNNICHILRIGSKYPSRGYSPIGHYEACRVTTHGRVRDGYSDPNRKNMSNIIFLHILPYSIISKLFFFIFSENLYHYNRNYFLTSFCLFGTSTRNWPYRAECYNRLKMLC